jgi:transposase
MKPVVGIDVAKGKSVIQAFLKRHVPYGRDQHVMHTPKGFEWLRELLVELESKSGHKPGIILEPTGHYHRVLVMYLQREGYEVILVNPLQAQRARRIGLRKVKTDASDAWHLGDLFYQEENWKTQPIREECLMDLQFLTRQHEFVTSIYVQSKLNMRSLIDQVFPGYEGVFRDLFSKTSLRLLEDCLSPLGVQERTDEQWSEVMSFSIATVDAEQSPKYPHRYGTESCLQSQFRIRIRTTQHDWLSKSVSKTTRGPWKANPRVIGNASQFSNPKQLVAYAGLDPSVFSSGKFVASNNKISKRGSKRLRRAAFLAVVCGLRGGINPRTRALYDKKKGEGKPHKVAVIACANKLLHHVYAMLKSGSPYTL